MIDEQLRYDASFEEARDRSLPDDLRDLASDARALAEAELAFQKARAAYFGSEMRGLAVFGIVAAVLAFFAVMALIVGLIGALTPELGPWGAMAVVTGALLVLVAVFALGALSRWKRMMRTLEEPVAQSGRPSR